MDRGGRVVPGATYEVLVVRAALLVWPLEELDTGWAEAAGSAVSVLVVACVVVVPVVAVAACGSGEPANVTAPSASAKVASVAAATRRWTGNLEEVREVEGMQASCARTLRRGRALPGRSLSLSRALAR